MKLKKTLKLCLTLALMAIALTLFALPSSAAAVSGSCGDSLTWVFDAGTGVLTIEGSGYMTDYTNYEDTAPWSAYQESITSVVLPDGLTSIGDYAFYQCTALESVTVPESVVRMGFSAFENCYGLTEIRFNAVAMDDLYENNQAFRFAGERGEGITVTVGANVTRLPAHLLCPDLVSLNCHPTVTALVFEAGSVCQSIGEYAFLYDSELTEVEFPSSMTEIGRSAFAYTGLRKITFGENVNSIGEWAFGYTAPVSLELPDSLTSIGAYAFDACSTLTSIDFGEGVTSIGDAAFKGCTGLTALTIPDSVETIGAEAFMSCKALKSVKLGKRVTEIGTEAFADCDVMTELTLSDSLVSIGVSAFRDCVGLTTLTIPDSVTTIGTQAFYNCNGLTSLTIGKGMRDIGNGAFEYSWSLTEIHFNATEMNDLYLLTNHTFSDAGRDGEGISVTIGANVTRIPDYLFCPDNFSWEEHVPKIVSVVFEEGSACREIGGSSFTFCRGLTAITFPDGLTTIGGQAFEYTGLTSVLLPDSVIEIGAYSFQNCTELTDADLGNGIRYIGSYAFRGCENLKSCSLGNSLESFGDNSFEGCTSLTSIEIPASLTEYSVSPFDECTNLETVYISSSVLAEQMTASYGGGHLIEYADTVMIDRSIDLPDDFNIVDYPYTFDTVYNGKNYWVWTQTPLEEEHEHIFLDTWRSDENTHWNSCNRCAEKQNIASHEYDNNCDGECNVCGYAREIPHEYDHACDEQCNVCGEWRFTHHEYDYDCDPDCNVCGEVRKTAHSDKPDWFTDEENHWLECQYCNAVTFKDAHEWHFGKVTKEATVEEEGEKTYWCDCGASDTQAIERLKAPEKEENGNDGAADTASDRTSDGNLRIPVVVILLVGGAVTVIIVLRRRQKAEDRKRKNE